MLHKIIFFTILLLSHCPFTNAQEAVRDGHVEARLIAENQSIQPGHPFWIAVHLTIDKGWHVYWENAGDSGLPVKATWNLPDHFNAGPLQWPYPEKIQEPPLVGYGYHDEVFLLTKIDLPSGLTTGEIKTLKDVGDLLCLTRERIRQIEEKALLKLREALEAKREKA